MRQVYQALAGYMKKWIILLLLAISSSPFLAAQARNKTGVFASYTIQNDLMTEEYKSFSFGVYRNYRLVKTLYYQPEISYRLINSQGAKRETFIQFSPVQLQFGFHLGLVRPFVNAGAFYSFAATARNEHGDNLILGSFRERSSYGYYYGGGIDILNGIQLFFRYQERWMPEQQVGFSFIF